MPAHSWYKMNNKHCANYRLFTRVVIIPFKEPSITICYKEQCSAFTLLKRLKNNANTSIECYIKLGKIYKQEGAFEIDDYKDRVSKMLPNCGVKF